MFQISNFRRFQILEDLHSYNEISSGWNSNVNRKFIHVSYLYTLHTYPEDSFMQYFSCAHEFCFERETRHKLVVRSVKCLQSPAKATIQELMQVSQVDGKDPNT